MSLRMYIYVCRCVCVCVLCMDSAISAAAAAAAAAIKTTIDCAAANNIEPAGVYGHESGGKRQAIIDATGHWAGMGRDAGTRDTLCS